MPHVNDRTDFDTVCSLFAFPQGRLVRRWVNGRLLLDDIPERQATFNGLFFQNLVSPQPSLPWDQSFRRSFKDLTSYFNWVFPDTDRYLISASSASRVVSYLLPYTSQDAGDKTIVSGFPGLRLHDVRPNSYVLKHLPSGGLLEVCETAAGKNSRDKVTRKRSGLDRELRVSRRLSPAWTPIWNAEELVPGEMRLFDELMHPSKLFSALAARGDLLLRLGQNVVLTPSPRTPSSLGVLAWEWIEPHHGVIVPDLLDLLTGKLTGIPGAEVQVTDNRECTLKLGDETIMIQDPRYLR